jgi:hypothetical protein
MIVPSPWGVDDMRDRIDGGVVIRLVDAFLILALAIVIFG